jgi:hypothetical protein
VTGSHKPGLLFRRATPGFLLPTAIASVILTFSGVWMRRLLADHCPNRGLLAVIRETVPKPLKLPQTTSATLRQPLPIRRETAEARIGEGEMRRDRLACWLLLRLMVTVSPEVFAQTNIRELNVDGIAKAIGKEGDLTGEMYKVSFPRSDLTVKAGNLVIKPALALVN